MYIDSHCHLDRVDLSPYDGDFDAMLRAAQAEKIAKMLCVSIELEQFEGMYDRIKDYSFIDASVGIHPLNTEGKIVEVDTLVELAKRPRIVAIGESGLDYFYTKEGFDIQQQSFINHLKASAITGLPTIVHTRDAREDTLKIIADHGDEKVAGVLHCFTESLEMAQAAVEMGYMVSFSGIVTFKNAESLREVVKALPLDKILIETDSPYLAPVPHRGKKNEPKYVTEVAQCIADLKSVRVEALAEATSDNFYRLFSKAEALPAIA